MKKFLIALCMTFFVGNSMYASSVQQHLPSAVSDDAELMFDEGPDALDAVTAQDCGCSRVKNCDDEKQTMLQSCYQTALIYLLGSYLSLKSSCASAKEYVASLLVWKPTSSVATSLPSVGE